MPPTSPATDPLGQALRVLSRRWTLEILEALTDKPRRFSEVHQTFPGLSERVMWERLRDLGQANLIERTVDPGPPITSTYRPTPRAQRVLAELNDLRAALGLDAAGRDAA